MADQGGDGKDNVVGINSARKKKEPKPKKIDIFRSVYDAIDHAPANMLPEYPHNYVVVEDDKFNRGVYYCTTDNVVKPMGFKGVVGHVLHYCENEAGGYDLGFDHDVATKCVKGWLLRTQPTPENTIKPVAALSDPCLTWHRLPFDLSDMPTPIFDEICGRMTHSTSFKAFVGSLLFEEADREQYSYLYGEGQNSKGTLLRFLAKVLGPAYKSETTGGVKDKFWTWGLIGSRLVAFGECNNNYFVTGDLFKSLTGSDYIRVEEKGGGIRSVMFNCKFIFTANFKPQISSSHADFRRIMFHKLEPLPKGKRAPVGSIDRALFAEAPGILWKCQQDYLELCPGHQAIPYEDEYDVEETLEGLVSHDEEAYDAIVEKFFNISPNNEITTLEMASMFDQARIRSNSEKSRFLQFIARKWQIMKMRVSKSEKERKRVYKGASLKDIYRNRL